MIAIDSYQNDCAKYIHSDAVLERFSDYSKGFLLANLVKCLCLYTIAGKRNLKLG